MTASGPAPIPAQNIASLQAGALADLVAGVADLNIKTTKGGASYAEFRLADASGSIRAILWDWELFQAIDPSPVRGSVVKVRANVKPAFTGAGLELEVRKARMLAAGEYEPGLLLAVSEVSPDRARAGLAKVIATIDPPELRRLLETIFSGEFLDLFLHAPAAQSYHHSTIGGLAEHTLELCDLAFAVQSTYPYVDRSLLLAGVLLHDHAKVWEYSAGVTIEMTDLGRLVGHIALGIVHVDRIAQEVGLSEEMRLRVLHLIAAHQGKLEFGSPKLPQTAEAELLFRLDDLSATMWKIKQAYESPAIPGERWTSKSNKLGRAFFRGTAEAEAAT